MLWLAVTTIVVVGLIAWHATAKPTNHRGTAPPSALHFPSDREPRPVLVQGDAGPRSNQLPFALRTPTMNRKATRVVMKRGLPGAWDFAVPGSELPTSPDFLSAPRSTFITEPPGFSLYSYLLLGDTSDAGKVRRLAAARAYCTNLPPASLGSEQTRHEPINVIIVVMRPTVPVDLKECGQNGSTIEEYYDHEWARDLLHRLDLRVDGMYLVAAPQRLMADGVPEKKKILTLNITSVRPELIELSLIRFRNLTRKPEYTRKWDFEGFVYELRIVLPMAAELVRYGTATAKELKQ